MSWSARWRVDGGSDGEAALLPPRIRGAMIEEEAGPRPTRLIWKRTTTERGPVTDGQAARVRRKINNAPKTQKV